METFGLGADTPARPKVLSHLVKILIWGGCVWCIGAITWSIVDTPSMGFSPVLTVLIGFAAAWLPLAAFLRNIHALVARPALTLSADGIRLRCWEPVSFPCWAMFKPFYRILDRTVPLAEFRGCRTFTHSVNSVPVHKAVFLATASGEIEIGWDVFRPGVGRIQTRILDFFERQVMQPAREAARVADFQRQRFREPLEYPTKVSGPVIGTVSLLLTVVAVAAIWQLVPDFPDTAWMWVPFATAVTAYVLLQEWWKGRGFRYVRLDSDGVAMGTSALAAQSVPWDQILFVRRHSKTEGYAKSAAVTGIEIRQTSGRLVVIAGMPAAKLDELAALIDPPVALVTQARQRMAAGEPAEAAAVAVGMRSRPAPAPAK
ncbi:MAG TPA: hypothetical protein VMD31_00760 [Opitutaceae bacterium]|nr:hypothetical protein [Opitutaceae bacterium]